MNKLKINNELEVLIGTKEDLENLDVRRKVRNRSHAVNGIYDRLPCTSFWMNKKFYILIQIDSDLEYFNRDIPDLFRKEYVDNCGYPCESLYSVWNYICSYID